jgi:hypothetical protein
MTISKVEDGNANCVWFADTAKDMLCVASIPTVCLTKIEADPPEA